MSIPMIHPPIGGVMPYSTGISACYALPSEAYRALASFVAQPPERGLFSPGAG